MKTSRITKFICAMLLLAVIVTAAPLMTFTAQASGSEVLKNNSFSEGLSDWEIFGKSNEVIYDPDSGDEIRFYSTSGNNSSGIRQRVDINVFNCSAVTLTAKFRVDRQRLSGTGWQAREAPFFVFVTYTDVNNVLHDQLLISPGYYPGEDQSRRMYWHGFYYLDPDENSLSAFGSKVDRCEQYRYCIDLMKEVYPRPKIIHYVGVGGSGWPERDGTVTRLSLVVWD